ncbi:YebC/PmpR family DNA-binding transcriptional regulator [Candidatus Peregrinibacteria bacterium]|nr:YebC/PmpR family DNA-binding transcriptional regulator [Candidatus Peregrinibacteria bacterium]
MSGHHTIEKGANDAQRGKIFTRHGHLIAKAAQSGGDPSTNPTLRFAIESAKMDNVPNVNIDRAIKRGTGELKGEAEIAEIAYEGRGPSGIAVIVECLTDNKNRTVTNVRTAFGKNGGTLGNSGTVAWMFDKKGLIVVATEGKAEEIELEAIDAGADDIQAKEKTVEIYTPFTALHKTTETLRAKGFKIEKAEVTMKPKETVRIDDVEKARSVLNFINTLEEDGDVTNVYSNVDIPESVLEKIRK